MTLAPWHADNWQRLLARRAQDRLPHALLLCGAAGLGQREFAERLAAMILCERDDAPCGTCHACHLYAQRFQRDPEETRPDGMLSQPHGHPGHPDARFVGHALNEKSSPKKMYTELTVDQIRDLSAWLVLPPQLGRAQVALIDPADELNVAASNALLKTLEEPGERRHLVLVSSRPARLSATIRSRCQRVEFHLPAREQAQAWRRQAEAATGRADAAAEQRLKHTEALMTPVKPGNAVNAAQHVWSYFKGSADKNTRLRFDKLINKVSMGESTIPMKRLLLKLAEAQQQHYLLNSLYFMKLL